MWIAQDEDGSIYTYAGKPEPRITGFYHDTVIDRIQRSCDKWKSSLINLETHDYKIEDGILMKVEKVIFEHDNPDITKSHNRHKHADLIHAWADGAEIQVKLDNSTWGDCIGNDPAWSTGSEYRIKPKTKTVRFRNYIDAEGEVCVTTCEDKPFYFREWIGDWQEVEVTE